MNMRAQLGLKRGSALLSLGVALSVSVACGSDGDGTGNTAGTAASMAGTTAASGSGGSAAGVAGAASAGSASGGTAGASAGSAGAAGSAGVAGSAGSGGSSSGCSVSKTDDAQPMMLSQTGCIDMADPTKPAPGLVPYSVRSPLWSDAATKERFLRIPEGTKIHALDCAVDVDACKAPGLGGIGADEGHWIMPVGAVLVKSFSVEGKRIETRLLMRRSNLV